MPEKNDIDWVKQTLRATFPYLVFILVFMVGSLVIMIWASAVEGADDIPKPMLLERAHSHNDYTRKNPLDDALALGFCSVEADIFLVDDALLVAHDRDKVDGERTLSRLYLEPLWARFQKFGSIYPTAASFTLLIDIKSHGAETFAALNDLLTPFAPMLTHFDDGAITPGAVTIIISGDRAFDAILAAQPRLAGVDGRLPDLDGAYTAAEMPLISDNWNNHFKWRGVGDMPEDEASKLTDIINRAHAKGMRVRFWAIPHREELWQALYKAGVDLINADDLPRLRELLVQQMARP